MKVLTIDPITRLEGHLKVQVTLDSNNIVVEAKAGGNLYRDFENMLVGRDPKDAPILTQRMCGVCPITHAIAASKAIEKMMKFTPSVQAVLIRNIVEAANFISNNILHFYHLSLMDYISGPQMNPWSPGFKQDLRFSDADNKIFNDNYIKALEFRRKAHEMGAIFGGKIPHAANIVPGGVTTIPSSANIASFKTYLTQITDFVKTIYKNDVAKLAATYNDYYSIGTGYGNLLSYGVFEGGGTKLFNSGVITNNGAVKPFSISKIREYVGYSWYSSPSGKTPDTGSTVAKFGKSCAYSYIKAPRYENLPYETGSLARMKINNLYTGGISVMDRHIARQKETEIIVDAMAKWIGQVQPNVSGYTNINVPVSGEAAGITEAPRGALGHWVKVQNSKISSYQIVTPTCFNLSPKDDMGNNGPVEKSLLGIKVANVDEPVELIRVIHSFDPCTGCSVHVISPEGIEMSKFVVEPLGC